MDDAVLPVLPWTAAALGLVLFVGLQVPVPPSGRRPVHVAPSPVGGPAGAALLAAALVLAAAVARLGPPSELDNPAPALVLGLGLPLLLVLPALLSLLSLARRRHHGRDGRSQAADPDPDARPDADPDAEPDARPDAGPDAGHGHGHGATDDVRPAVPLAALLAVVLVVLPERSRPAVLAAVLAGYGVVVLALGVAGGRRQAARGEVLGLLGRWSGLGPRLPLWAAPRGATAVLVLLLAAGWAERFSRSAAWTGQAPGRGGLVLLLGLAVAAAGTVAVVLRGRGAPAVLLPLAAGALVAGGLRRALVSGQLLAAQVSPRPVDPDPLGIAGGQGVALAVAVVAGAASAAVLARRCGPGADRLPGLTAVLAATAVTCVVVLQP